MSGCQKSLSLTFWAQITYKSVFHLQDHIRTGNLSDLVGKFTDWERFQGLAPELISPGINSGEEADKAACDFTASIALAYRLSTGRIKLSDLNKDLLGLESAKHNRRLRKLWQVTWDQACKTGVNCQN
jgi:hypothetical protein